MAYGSGSQKNRLVEYVPKGQDSNDWQEKLTVLQLHDMSGDFSEFFISKQKDLGDTCAQVNAGKTDIRELPEQKIFTANIECIDPDVKTSSQSADAAKVRLIYAYRGIETSHGNYFIYYTWFGSEQELRTKRPTADHINSVLDKVSVCNFSNSDLVCPAAGILDAAGRKKFLAAAARTANRMLKEGEPTSTPDQQGQSIAHMMAMLTVEPEGFQDLPEDQKVDVTVALDVIDQDWSDMTTLVQQYQLAWSLYASNRKLILVARYGADHNDEDITDRTGDRVKVASYMYMLKQVLFSVGKIPDEQIRLRFFHLPEYY
ncbi:hypothetical protein [Emcibacter sp.]|uniref:hypothetical protein n=1 Tax=Emcibacter sp. TaxID=1979954 RepID=UPI002AA67696|nr:hypothetical protein [Emcibacter sp.]